MVNRIISSKINLLYKVFCIGASCLVFIPTDRDELAMLGSCLVFNIFAYYQLITTNFSLPMAIGRNALGITSYDLLLTYYLMDFLLIFPISYLSHISLISIIRLATPAPILLPTDWPEVITFPRFSSLKDSRTFTSFWLCTVSGRA